MLYIWLHIHEIPWISCSMQLHSRSFRYIHPQVSSASKTFAVPLPKLRLRTSMMNTVQKEKQWNRTQQNHFSLGPSLFRTETWFLMHLSSLTPLRSRYIECHQACTCRTGCTVTRNHRRCRWRWWSRFRSGGCSSGRAPTSMILKSCVKGIFKGLVAIK